MSEKAQEVRKRRLESIAYLKDGAEIAFDFILNEFDEVKLFENTKSERGSDGFGSTDINRREADPTQTFTNTETNMTGNTQEVVTKSGRGRPKKKVQ